MFKFQDVQFGGQEVLSILGAAGVLTSLVYFFVF